jgi:hypothetical protein
MFFAVCDFAALYRAALCAARVEVSAAVSSSGGGIWGRERPPLPPPNPVPGLDPWGSLTPGMSVAVVRQNRARFATSPSEPRVSRAMPLLFPSNVNTTDRLCRKDAFI